jgi:hypothetical protein
MFPSVKTRLSLAARRGIDLAIEFSTLGEYRLPASESPGGSSVEPPGGGAGIGVGGATALTAATITVGADTDIGDATALNVARGPGRPRAARLRPATAAARRLQPVAPPRRIASHSGVRALALAGSRPEPRRGARARGGAASPRPQPCLVSDAGAGRTMRG